MKEWILYCILCSLIYAMAVHAKVTTSAQALTAELVFIDGSRKPVRDCAVFLPPLGKETYIVMNNLKTLGFSPQISSDIRVEKIGFQDSNGHKADKYETHFAKRIGYYGQYTVLLSVQGVYQDRKKKRTTVLKLHRLGAPETEVASSPFTGIASERMFSVTDLPRCQPKIQN